MNKMDEDKFDKIIKECQKSSGYEKNKWLNQLDENELIMYRALLKKEMLEIEATIQMEHAKLRIIKNKLTALEYHDPD
jgi:hypothetical protein